MEILELNMKHFGKFLEHRMKLLPGINVIYGGNETGKTTMHAFIRAMFFGIDTGRGRRGEEYLLRQPWDNPAYFAGSMRLEFEGKVYRIERNFYRNDRQASLICETTGEELDIQGREMAAILAGMSETAFCNTVFVPQSGSQTSQEFAKELRNFMINFQETRQDLDVEGALGRLKAQKRELENKKKQEQELLDEKIARKEMERELLERELAQMTQSRPETGPLTGDEDGEIALFPGVGRENSRSEKAQDAEEERRREGREERSEERGQERGEEKSRDEDSRGFYPTFLLLLNVLLLAAGALGIACGIFAGGWLTRVLLMGFGILMLALFVMTLRYTWRERHELFNSVGKRPGGPLFGTAGDGLFPEEEESGGLSARMKGQSDERGSGDGRNGRGKLGPDRAENEAGAGEKRRLERERRLGRQQERSLRRQEQSLRARSLKEEQEALFQEREALYTYDRRIEAVELAMMRIREVSQQIYRETGTGFGDRASEILEELTEGRYTHIALDEKMQVKINTPSKLLDLNQVSWGTMNQVYFALRMAAGELLAGGEEIPVILDEPFAMYDDERLEAAMRWLNDSGRQVILFTCQRREKEILDGIRMDTRVYR